MFLPTTPIAALALVASLGVPVPAEVPSPGPPGPVGAASGLGPERDTAAPWFWDEQDQTRIGAEARRFEVAGGDGARASAWYWLTYVPGGDRVQVYGHTAPTSTGRQAAIAASENVAWHVATTLLGRARGLAHVGEIPDAARPLTGTADGSSAGLVFALAALELQTHEQLAGGLRVAATGAIGSDGSVTAVRGVDAKEAAARLAAAEVMFAPDFPEGFGAVTRIAAGDSRAKAIGDLLALAAFETAGRRAASTPARLALVEVHDVRQALAWLCGRTATATTCALAHTVATTPVRDARPYAIRSGPTASEAGRRAAR